MALLRQMKSPFDGVEPLAQNSRSLEAQSVGQVLRRRRMALEIAIEDVATVLKIKSVYLLAIEEGRPSKLPGPAYAVGFIRSYSEYLGLDSAELVRQYKVECAGLDAKPDLTFPMPLGKDSLPGGRVLILGTILAACAYGVWYQLRAPDQRLPEPVTELPAEIASVKPQAAGASKPIPAVTAVGLPDRLDHDGAGGAPVRADPVGSSPAASRQSGPDMAANAALPRPPASDFRREERRPSANPVASASPMTSGGASTTVGQSRAPVAAGPMPALADARPPQSSEPVLPVKPVGSGSVPVGLSAAGGTPVIEPRANAATEGTLRDGEVRSSVIPEQQSRIALQVSADTWIQIRAADHSILFTGMLKRGDNYRVPDISGLTMRTGNAGGVNVIVDGKPTASLGPMGAVRNVVLNPQSLIGRPATGD
jgi:cytoskeleton protein RodZ